MPRNERAFQTVVKLAFSAKKVQRLSSLSRDEGWLHFFTFGLVITSILFILFTM